MNKESQLRLGAAAAFFLLLALLVIATDTSFNSTENQTIDAAVNETVEENVVLEQANNLSINETEPITNDSEPVIPEEKIFIDEEDSFSKVVEENDFKLNEKTKKFLESSPDKNEEKSFIIKYRPGFDKAKLDSLSAIKNFEDFKISSFMAKVEDVKGLISDDEVELVELDQELKITADLVPSNVIQVGADSAWNLSKGAGIKVAVLDTGIAAHNDLNVAGGWNVMDDSPDYSDEHGHGTMVTGILAALMNEQGLVGVSPDVSVYAVKIMEEETGSLSDAIAGVEWTIDNDMNIVSMSFGFEGYSEIFKDALSEAYGSGILLIAASGNDGTDTVMYPAAYTDVIAVGAVDENNDHADFSNYGYELELVAPGVNINSTSLADGYSVASGTSLVVPHVAGVAALIWSYNQNLSNEEVRAKLRNDALDLGDAGKDDYYGYGLVQTNLSAENYNYTPMSYYYEVFNISDYGLENESYLFWLSGNGTIDDVNFSEGYYLINKTINETVISQKIFVSENGTIRYLAVYYVYIVYADDYNKEGNTSDGITWAGGDLNVSIDYTAYSGTVDGECFRFSYDLFTYGYCYFDDSKKNYCRADSTLIDCGDPPYYTQCYDSITPGGSHSIINTSSAKAYTGDAAGSHYVSNCGTAYFTDFPADNSPKPAYVINKKRFHCINSTQYTYQGWYGTGWTDYADGACSGTCDDNGALNYTDENDMVPNPCLGNTTDLAIVNIIPIQVIPGVDMVKDKSGYVVVNVSNTGNPATANVSAWFEGAKLNISTHSFGFSNENPRQMAANKSGLFVFDFKPSTSGTSKVITVNVEVI